MTQSHLPPSPRRQRSLWAVALACSLLLTLITVLPPVVPGDWARLNASGVSVPVTIRYPWPSAALQILLLPGIVLPVLAAGGWSLRRQTTAPRGQGPLWLLVAGLTLLGFGLRLHTLDQLPLIIDEIGFAARASDILHGTAIPIFAPAHNGNPAAFSWLVAGSMQGFGQTRFAIRLIALAAGVLTIPAAYRLGRAWWGPLAGGLAAAFVAVYPAHVHFSRLALYNVFDPLWGMLVLAALKRAADSPASAHRHRIMAGLLAGIAQSFYHGSRLLLLLFALDLILRAGQQRSGWRTLLREAVDLALPFLLISLPRFVPLFSAGLPLTGNLEALRPPPDAAANALRSLLAWVGQPDVSPFWLSTSPLLPMLFLLPVALGLWLCLRRGGQPERALLPLMLLLTTAGGGMLWPAAPLYVRYLSALPALALLAALPFARWMSIPSWRRWTAGVFVGLMLAQGVLLSLRHPQEAHDTVRPGLWEADHIAQQAAALPEGAPLVVRVSDDFTAVERITISDWVAAYGTRRPLRVQTGG